MILIGRGLDFSARQRLIGKNKEQVSLKILWKGCAVVRVWNVDSIHEGALSLIREETSRRKLADERETEAGRN